MAVVVERTANIASAPETVWDLLIRLETWKTWWPDCIEAHTMDNRALREDSRIELVLQPKHRKLTVNPVVDMLTAGRTLSLTQQSALIQGTVAWTLAEGPMGAKVSVRGVFTGFQVWLMGLASQNDIFQFSLYSNMRGLKKLAERMV